MTDTDFEVKEHWQIKEHWHVMERGGMSWGKRGKRPSYHRVRSIPATWNSGHAEAMTTNPEHEIWGCKLPTCEPF